MTSIKNKSIYEKLLKIHQLKPNDNTIIEILNIYPNITAQQERFISQTYQTENARYLRVKQKQTYQNTIF
jgi:hypothetical protein